MSLAPLWIALAVLAARDGCDSQPAPGSGSGSGSAVASPTLAPAAAPPAGSAAPTTTTMSKDAQAKLDKLVGAKPGSHKPIKPTPEPPPPKATADAKPAKKKNQFPYDGREMSESEMFSYPDMDRSKESYDYGATVREGFSSVPHYVAYRCVTQPTCHGWSSMGQDWKAIGWWGAVF